MDLPPLIGQSPPLLEVMERASRVAALDRPVLVIGERGTGKELIAARVHYLSPRWDGPLVKVNCAALPESLLETELFGHEAGAFTGAVRRRLGRFERAHEGTLFMDEIAAASPAVQEKVLRVIEYGELERVGSSGTVHVDVRVVAATNVDLPAEAAAGRFRHDLLDRLAFEVLTVPPLRARPGDVAILAAHFGRAMASEAGWEDFPGFGVEAMAALEAHDWPGNVRELKNAVERAVHHWPDPDRPIGALQLDPFESPYRPRPTTTAPPPASLPTARPPTAGPPTAGSPSAGPGLRAVLEATEKRLLTEALEATRFNRRAAAVRLGLTYDQLRGRLAKHGL